MPRSLKKGRDRCTAIRRDGEPCEAPAVPETLVCLTHGGAAPQVQIASQHRQLQLRSYTATQEWLKTRGGPGENAALTRHGEALSELHYFEERLARLRELQAEVRRRKAEDSVVDATGVSSIVRLAKLQRQLAEQKRWKPRRPAGETGGGLP